MQSREDLLNRVSELQQQVLQLNMKLIKKQKPAYIYGYEHIEYKTIDYVGFTLGELQKRQNSHITDMGFQVKIPFYKLILQQVILEKFTYTDKKEVLAKEKFYQNKHKSIQKSDSLYCQGCSQTYKQQCRLLIDNDNELGDISE